MPAWMENDSSGMTHLRYQQQYNGIPVLGSELFVHFDGTEKVIAANGHLVADLAIRTTPQISEQDAAVVARQSWAAIR